MDMYLKDFFSFRQYLTLHALFSRKEYKGRFHNKSLFDIRMQVQYFTGHKKSPLDHPE